MMKYFKRYVGVVEYVDPQGRITPKVLCWENGTQYPIDKILEIRPSASHVGGCGILYRCRIAGRERNLFYERDRWFIESTKP